jgi:hypothetical protein
MKLFYLNLFFSLFFSSVLFSQEEENAGFDQYSSSVFNSKKNALYLISGMRENQAGVVLPIPTFSLVVIDQIGQNNYADTNLKAKYIDVAVTQRGDNNQFIIDKQANIIVQNVYQNGQNNSIRDFSLKMNDEVNAEYIQQGDNQNIQIMGSNSLSKNMKVIQSGNGASVLILNQ